MNRPRHSAILSHYTLLERLLTNTHTQFTRNGSISGSGNYFLSKMRWLFLARIHGSSNLSQIREELRLFFVRLWPPLIVAAVFLALCRSLCTMCWISFSYSFACISYPASTTHSHTHTDTLICTVKHKHNHRQRCTLLCNFFLHALVFCCLAKLFYFFS